MIIKAEMDNWMSFSNVIIIFIMFRANDNVNYVWSVTK